MFALKSPGGHLLLETIAERRRDVWPRAEVFFRKQLGYRFVADYQSKARRSGWVIVPIVVGEAKSDGLTQR